MRGNLDRTLGDLQRAQGNTGADREGQRRSILGALGAERLRPAISPAGQPGRRLLRPPVRARDHPQPGSDAPAAASGTYRTLCVRTCDGFYFPISYSTVPSKFADDEKTCQRLCPAAEVALYSHRNPGEDVAQAVSASGRLYSELPNAFAYRKQFNPSCSCKAAGQTWADALKQLDDQTVERGDIVVTEERAKQLSQPQVDAQGKPIRPAPAGRPGARPTQGVAAAPATQASAPADTTGGRPTPASATCARSARPSCRRAESRSRQPIKIERLGCSAPAPTVEQRAVGLRQRRAGIAEAVGDRIAAVAAEILAASP